MHMLFGQLYLHKCINLIDWFSRCNYLYSFLAGNAHKSWEQSKRVWVCVLFGSNGLRESHSRDEREVPGFQVRVWCYGLCVQLCAVGWFLESTHQLCAIKVLVLNKSFLFCFIVSGQWRFTRARGRTRISKRCVLLISGCCFLSLLLFLVNWIYSLFTSVKLNLARKFCVCILSRIIFF